MKARIFFIFISIVFFAALVALRLKAIDSSLTSLSFYHPLSTYIDIKDYGLQKGERINGEFIALADRLGTILIHFDDKQQNDDIITFRLKEESAPDWYYEQNYHAVQFTTLPLFPFGFPVIENSLGKKYRFEIESTKARDNNGVMISRTFPSAVSRYYLTKSMLLSAKALPGFLFLKIKNNFQNSSFGFSFVLYITSLFFLTAALLYSSFFKKTKHIAYVGMFLLSIYQLFMVEPVYFPDTILITFLIMGLFIADRRSYRFFLIFSLVLFAFGFPLYVLGALSSFFQLGLLAVLILAGGIIFGIIDEFHLIPDSPIVRRTGAD